MCLVWQGKSSTTMDVLIGLSNLDFWCSDVCLVTAVKSKLDSYVFES